MNTPLVRVAQKLAEKVKEGIRAGGGTPLEFNTTSVTDGIAMGTEGMKASLVSRKTVADSVELIVRGHLLDAFVGISGCDKTIPGMVMAMAHLNIPSVMLYGGSIAYGEYKGNRLTVQGVFGVIAAFNALALIRLFPLVSLSERAATNLRRRRDARPENAVGLNDSVAVSAQHLRQP